MNIAFIPVRGGSKSIPLKNIKPLLSLAPLRIHCVQPLFLSKYIPLIRILFTPCIDSPTHHPGGHVREGEFSSYNSKQIPKYQGQNFLQ